jgi:hypothetical protein
MSATIHDDPKHIAQAEAARRYRERQKGKLAEAAKPRPPLRTELDMINLEASNSLLHKRLDQQDATIDKLRRDLDTLTAVIGRYNNIRKYFVSELDDMTLTLSSMGTTV